MGQESKAKYKDTVNLPETAFPMKADLATREPQILETWQRTKLYERIQEARAKAPLWILHDGPPYSNGNIHYGHILNKILKDIVVKSRTMAGFRTPYVPGWDTHGLPIELAVEREIPRGKREAMSPAEIRGACRDYALRWVDVQRKEFQRLGVLGDWDRPYLTLSPTYEGANRPRAREVHARWLPVPRQQAGAVVPARQDGARGRRGRVRGQVVALDLRAHAAPAGGLARQARRAPRGQAALARHLDDDPVDPAGEPRGGGAPAARVRRAAEPARSGRVPDGRARAGGGVPGRDRRGRRGGLGRARGGDRDLAGAGGDARGRALPAPVHQRAGARRGLPAVARHVRHGGHGHRPRAHGAGPRRGRLQDGHGARPAGVRAARRRRALPAGHRPRGRPRARGPLGRVDGRGEPDHRRAPRGDGVPAQRGAGLGAPQLPALLAVQGADRVPRDAAVVPLDGPRGAPQARARGDPQDGVDPGVGRGAHLRDDREPPGLGALAAAPVGDADPGVLLHGVPGAARERGHDGAHRRDLREGGRGRVVVAAGARPRAAGDGVRGLRRGARGVRAREGHRGRVVRVRRVVARDGAPRSGPRERSICTSRARTSTAAGSTARCSRRSA